MHRPISVTICAVVALTGGAMVMGGAAAMFAVMRTLPRLGAGNAVAAGLQQAPGLVAALVAVAVVGLAAIATGLGLLRMRPWARVSALVVAALLVFVGLMMIAMTLALPALAPPGAAPAVAPNDLGRVLRPYVVPLVIGVWWLVQFNRPSVAVAFQQESV